MKVTVQTGQTKAAAGMKLSAQSFSSAQKEDVCLLLQVHATPQEAKTLEKEAITVVTNALLETEGDSGARLDGALKELNGLFKGFLLARKVEDVHAIVAIVGADGALNVSHAGRAEAYVVRGGTASQITEYTRGKPTPAFVHIASGVLEPRDTVVFSTQRLLRTFTPAQLAQLAQRGNQLTDEIIVALEAEKEVAAITIMYLEGTATRATAALPARGDRRRRGQRRATGTAGALMQRAVSIASDTSRTLLQRAKSAQWMDGARTKGGQFFRDLRDPKRKRRAHFLFLAGVLVVFLLVWAVVNVSTYSQRTKTRAELEQLIQEIESDLQTAENRYLTREIDSANAILQRAEERAKQVMDNENKLFRTEAHDLLGRIRAKREEINNIVRLSPRTVVNLTAKNPDILAKGLIGLADGEFIVYDQQDLYRVLLNSIDEPDRLSDDELIVNGVSFPRYKTLVFQTNDNSLMEIISGQPTSMKTEDPAGWITGKDMEAYLGYIYILSPENNQIYKYERFSNRYSAPSQYNVNGALHGALDMAIDGNVYVLKEGGEVLKLFRGETRPFAIRGLPNASVESVTKIYKAPEGNLYLLDPQGKRVMVVSDGGAAGDAAYIKQFVLEGELTDLQDLYVDDDETRLYVLDKKRIYAVDL